MTDKEKIKRLARGCKLLIDALRKTLPLMREEGRESTALLLDDIEHEVDKLVPRKPVHTTVKRLFGGTH